LKWSTSIIRSDIGMPLRSEHSTPSESRSWKWRWLNRLVSPSVTVSWASRVLASASSGRALGDLGLEPAVHLEQRAVLARQLADQAAVLDGQAIRPQEVLEREAEVGLVPGLGMYWSSAARLIAEITASSPTWPVKRILAVLGERRWMCSRNSTPSCRA
jgi:hypothetical protein